MTETDKTPEILEAIGTLATHRGWSRTDIAEAFAFGLGSLIGLNCAGDDDTERSLASVTTIIANVAAAERLRPRDEHLWN